MKARKEATKRAAVAALGLTLAVTLFLSLARCTVDELKNIPTHADTLAYEELMETIRQLEGDSAAQVFAETRSPQTVVLTEFNGLLSGQVAVNIGGQTSRRHNIAYARLGKILAQGLRSGFTTIIDGMQAQLAGLPDGLHKVNMSVPQRTAGGRGSSSFVTVQSSWTNTGIGATMQLYDLSLFSFNEVIAYQRGGDRQVPDNDTLQVNWTINIGGNYSATQLAQMAKALSPESGYGGSMYPINGCKFVTSSGFVVSPPVRWWGGDGSTQEVLVEFSYTHSGSSATLTKLQILNSNGDVIHEVDVNIALNSGSIVHAYHRARFNGQ